MYKKRLFIIMLPVITVIAGILFYLFSGKFYAKNIEFLGQTDLKKEEIIAFSGIDTKKNIYLISLGSAKSKLLQNPYIASASVKRKFPDTLIFSVKQRLEVASLPISGAYAVIDSKGYVLRLVNDIKAVKKPLINGIPVKDAKLGSTIHFKDEKASERILGIVDTSNSLGLLNDISFVSFEDMNNITMTTNTGIDVLFGDEENLQYKIKFLSKIIIDLQAKGKHKGTIDFRYKSNPYYIEKTAEEVLSKYKKETVNKKTPDKTDKIKDTQKTDFKNKDAGTDENNKKDRKQDTEETKAADKKSED